MKKFNKGNKFELQAKKHVNFPIVGLLGRR
jgi:hypothetical protein